MDQEKPVEKKKPRMIAKIFHYMFITWILQPLGFYWCDKCQRLTRYDYQITIQPSLDGNKIKMKIPYCTRCLAIKTAKQNKIVKPYRRKIING